MGPKTRKLIKLGQTLEEKWQLGQDTSSETDHWENALVQDGYEEKEKISSFKKK